MNRAHTLIPRGLIVSCQAELGDPFDALEFIAAFARAAELGGAIALRIRDAENVRAVKRNVTLPVIGLTKGSYPGGEVLITPTPEEAEELVRAGADLVAVDATRRTRPNGLDGLRMIGAVRNRVNVPLVADVATFDEGIDAAKAGADLVATTLSGYTASTQKVRRDVPDLDLLRRLVDALPDQVVAEGRFWTPEQAALALTMGAHAVVVGTAITRPVRIVKRFVEALRLT